MSKPRIWKSETAKSVCEKVQVSDPVEGVIKLAEDLTSQCSLTRPAQNLAMLASFQGARIEELVMDDAGRLIPIFDGRFDYLIQVNSAHSTARKNFSICHEIGHTLMPNFFGAPSPRRDAEVMVWNEEAEEEFLCDVAASEILMPRREFVPRLLECKLKIESISELANEFGSSLEATSRNIVQSGIESLAVIIWEKDWNKQQKESASMPTLFSEEDGFMTIPKKFRIKTVLSCGELKKYHFPYNKSIEETSLIHQAAETETSVCGHQNLPIGGYNHKSFFTQSLSFPIWRDGTLERRVFTLVHHSTGE